MIDNSYAKMNKKKKKKEKRTTSFDLHFPRGMQMLESKNEKNCNCSCESTLKEAYISITVNMSDYRLFTSESERECMKKLKRERERIRQNV